MADIIIFLGLVVMLICLEYVIPAIGFVIGMIAARKDKKWYILSVLCACIFVFFVYNYFHNVYIG